MWYPSFNYGASMSTTPANTLNQELTAITSAVTGIQALVAPYAASSPVAASTVNQQCTIINNAVSTIQSTANAATAPAPTPPIVVVPPVTPPNPPAGNTPTSGLSGLGFTSDDFTSYGTTKALQAQISSNIGGTGNYQTCLYNDGYNGQLVSIDTSVLYNGHQTMKYSFPGGVQTYPGLWVNFQNGKSLTKMWLRAKIRFSPGWSNGGVTLPPDPNAANAYKLLGWAYNAYYSSGRLEITNGNEYVLYWSMQDKKTNATVGSGSYTVGGNITTEWTDGAWYDYILEVDFSKPAGLARVWIGRDGQTPVLRTTTTGSMTGGLAWPGISSALLGLNFDQTRAANQSQSLNYGQWEVISGTDHPDPFNLLSSVPVGK